ncbi:hypothetical protein ABL78_2941 [Leptomonas seymouri]|uniref:Uncharacterized protein n=1 Tax=Leptomonas seymouri TaxID=5684 RepID=A0A0N1I5H2_LEPSE|nr:hypothetical protein ABL78_2941 [Leptomonas seymouri]|eukprot:KPI87950.1 hypothetical protein ABL78_2941 [Leptomonas seymouri]
MMPVSVSMHACSVWPVSTDFTVFNFFLKGYSVEETVEELMVLQSVAPENAQATQRTSFASSSSSATSTASSSSSELSPHSPNNSAKSYSPTNSLPFTAHSRSHLERTRGSAEKRQDAHNTALGTIPTKYRLHANGSELLTEDTRVQDNEERLEDLALPSASPMMAANVPSQCTGSAGPQTSTAPVPAITAVDTSTNAARPPQTAAPPAQSRHPYTDGYENGQPTKISQQEQQQRSSHRIRRSPQKGRRHHNATHTCSSHHAHHSNRKRQPHRPDAIRSSSALHTTTTSAASTTTTSFVLTPIWSYDTNVNTHSSSSRQHTRHSSAMPSMEDFTTAADCTMAKGSSGSCNNTNTTTTTGDGKNSSSDNRRRARHKKRREQQCFFLNEDYMRFQRQLQEAEAIGGVGRGSSSLQSRFLFEEVTEQFQAFRELAREEQLGSPYAFLSNYYLPIPVAARLELLRMYYETDPGVFQWAFGDKLNRFDLPAALAEVRVEVMSGNLASSTPSKSLLGASGAGGSSHLSNGGGGGSIFGSASGAAGSVGGGSGGGGTFWSGRWKSSPGKLATMDAATLVRLSEQHTDALRRQWENVKHVCVTVAALYRGKGGMCVPLDMALLTTIQQCFGLRHKQALDYATAAFGYEHRLETRLFDRLKTFSEYGAICSIVASVWCDDSGYFLSDAFRAGCRRMGRLLDEYRLLSELHPFIFGEPMRPRWQVQLNEVQRVITTSSLVDKNAVASATAVAAAGSPVAPGTGSAGLSVAVSNNSMAGLAGGGSLNGAMGSSGGCNAGLASSGGSGGSGGGAGIWEGSSSSPSATATNTGNNSTNMHSPFSGNGQYSRQFLMEFPSLMKHLLRICVALSNSGGVNNALDIFFTRVYSYLEVLSSRTAPAIVSMVMNAAGSGGLAAAGLCSHHGSFVGGTAAAPNASPGVFGKPPLPPHVTRAHSHSDLGRAGTGTEMSASAALPPSQTTPGAASPATASSVHSISSPTMPPKAMSTPSFFEVPGSDRQGLVTTETLPSIGSRLDSSSVDDVLAAGSAIPYVASTVVNTSLFHPASALIPLSAAIAVHNASSIASNFSSAPMAALIGRNFSAEDEPLEWSTVATGSVGNSNNTNSSAPGAAAGLRSHNPSFLGVGGSVCGGAGAANSLSTSQVGDMVRKVVDKRFLRELCMLLVALPKAWRQLTTLTTEDHAATDKTMSDLAMALKAITQVLMASDDFH